MPFVMQPEAAAQAVSQVKASSIYRERERDSDRAVAEDATPAAAAPAPAERGLNWLPQGKQLHNSP